MKQINTPPVEIEDFEEYKEINNFEIWRYRVQDEDGFHKDDGVIIKHKGQDDFLDIRSMDYESYKSFLLIEGENEEN